MAVRLFRPLSRIVPNTRHIMSTSFDLNKVKEDLENNPFYKKYAGRIQHLEKASPDEFLSRLIESEAKKQPKESAIKTKEVIYADKKAPTSSQVKKSVTLDEIMKTSLLEGKSKEEIVEIWTAFHKGKDGVYGTLGTEIFQTLNGHSRDYPMFLLPLPRGQGFEFILLQFDNNQVHFTPLISYQTHKQDAPECLTLVYYTDLAETKGVVLLKGEFDKNILSALEAQCLVNTMHLYYGYENEKRTNLLKAFTYNPDTFTYMDLVAELDTLTLQ